MPSALSVRSTMYSALYSASIAPFSVVRLPTRKYAVARICSRVAFGSRSPASCHVRELVERPVARERVDDPIAVRPEQPVVMIVEKAVRLAEAREVEPIAGHVLGIRARGEQAVDEPLVRVGRRVGDERVDLVERRRQARQRQRDAIDQCFFVGLGCGVQAFALEPRETRSGRSRCAMRCANVTSGTAGRSGAMNAQCGRYSAPFSIHCSRIAICCAESVLCVDSGGMRSSTLVERILRTSSLRPALPGTIAYLPVSRAAPRPRGRADRAATRLPAPPDRGRDT